MRILHASLMLRMASGHEAQLRDEVEAANSTIIEESAHWKTVAFIPKATARCNSFEMVLPPWIVYLRLSKWYFWAYIYGSQNDFDYVLVRNFAPDPVAWLFAPRIANLITVHHTKELEEIKASYGGLRKLLLTFLEGPLKRYALRRTRVVVGVTPEIANYESGRLFCKPTPLVYRNGIDLNRYPVSNLRSAEGTEIEALMMASVFYPWHGLDLILDALSCNRVEAKGRLKLNLVGELTAPQRQSIIDLGLEDIVVEHGLLEQHDLMDHLARMDFAVGSFALFRKGLTEASTLKVREYLAAGLPVYSGHRDVAIPDDFPFYMLERDGPDVERMIAFGIDCRLERKTRIRECSIGLISKEGAMSGLIEGLRSLAVVRHDDVNLK